LDTVLYPTLEETLYLHRLLIDKFGGQHGVRDLGLLESALIRPRSGYYETLSLQAAALFHSLLLNHCFLDGNKRIAFALTATFLRLNGYALKVGEMEAEDLIIKNIIEQKASAHDIATWIENRLEKLV
jgi:death-on-curing protein